MASEVAATGSQRKERIAPARWVFLAACVVAVAEVWPGAAAQAPPRPLGTVPPAVAQNILDRVAAYGAGDDFAVERWLATPEGAASVSAVPRVVTAEKTGAISAAAFLLEVAAFRARSATPPGGFSAGSWTIRAEAIRDVRSILGAGQVIVTSRPTPLGADQLQDRFEMLWHQSALGLLQRLRQYVMQAEYLNRLEPRLVAAGTSLRRDSRLQLSRAMATEGLCCRAHGQTGLRITIKFVARPPSGTSTVDAAVALFDTAAQLPALRVEALIRGGALLQEAGRHADALAWFEQTSDHADGRLAYVQHLSRGRAFDALGRTPDALSAYRSALAAAPESQWAGIGLAAALLRTGQPDDASRAAVETRRGTAGIDDAERIAEFQQGDSRFVAEWVSEIRRLRR